MESSQTHIVDRARAVLALWYGDEFEQLKMGDAIAPEISHNWYMGGPTFDELIRTNFGDDLKAIARGEYDSWLTLENPLNALAGVILADQLTRNAYRGTPDAFALDGKAKAWAEDLVDSGRAQAIPFAMRAFLVLPFEHSEELKDVQRSVDYSAAELAAAQALPADPKVSTTIAWFHEYSKKHLAVIERYGRYPHRNAILGRPNTPEEDKAFADGTMPKF